MDKDIREFLDWVEQNRLYKEKRKRKERRLAKQMERQKRRTRRIATQSGEDILCGGCIKGDNELRQLADSGSIVKVQNSKLNNVSLRCRRNMIGNIDLSLFLYQWVDKTKNNNFECNYSLMVKIMK